MNSELNYASSGTQSGVSCRPFSLGTSPDSHTDSAWRVDQMDCLLRTAVDLQFNTHYYRDFVKNKKAYRR